MPLQFPKHSSSPCWDLAPVCPFSPCECYLAFLTQLRAYLIEEASLIRPGRADHSMCLLSTCTGHRNDLLKGLSPSEGHEFPEMSFSQCLAWKWSLSKFSVNAQIWSPNPGHPIYINSAKTRMRLLTGRQWISWLFLKNVIRKWILETNLSMACESLWRYFYLFSKL